MRLMPDINRSGFRPWYEGQLAGGFGFIALGLVLIVGGAAFLEAWLGHMSMLDDLVFAGSSFVCLGCGGYCWIKAAEKIGAAEHLAQQAVCKSCKAYGRLDVLSEVRLKQSVRLQAQCRKCNHQWPLEL
jgi:hypothetical protein